MQHDWVLRYLKVDPFFWKFQIQILERAYLGFLGSFNMLFLVLQANYVEKISLLGIFSVVNPNAPGLVCNLLLLYDNNEAW